jgi:SAM-dependent methyltransferase
MFTESAELYDAIYGGIKDYAAETAQIAALLRQARPAAETVLDVACGTGEHARLLAECYGFAVDGIDLDLALVEVARRKHPRGRFVQADMSDFDLGCQYDAVTCLFSSIGYLCTIGRVVQALSSFRRHTAAGGVVMVEPWFAPGGLDATRVSRHTVNIGTLRVERVSHVEIDGRISRLRFDYRIEGPDGVRLATEHHELGLFTPDEMRAAFVEAGLAAAYDPVGLTGRGLYLARPAAG